LFPTSTFNVDLRVSTGVVLGGGDLGEVTGGGLGAGEWIFQRLYLGGIGYGDEETTNYVFLLRLGAEARLAFAGGTASQSVNGGEGTSLGLRQWIGVAGGYESFLSLHDDGGWADLEYGLDFTGGLPFGFAVTLGRGWDRMAPSVVAAAVHDDLDFHWRFSNPAALAERDLAQLYLGCPVTHTP
jgi:hypothetical protein